MNVETQTLIGEGLSINAIIILNRIISCVNMYDVLICILFFHPSLASGSHPPTSKIKRARAMPLTGKGITQT